MSLQVALNKPLYQIQINIPDSLGYTPLHWATQMRDAAAVQALLQNGAEVNYAGSGNRCTPLHLCATNIEGASSTSVTRIQCTIAQLLLSAGADVNAEDILGFRVLHRACTAPIHLDFIKILIEKGALVNERSGYGLSPLSCAAAIGLRSSKKIAAAIKSPEIGAFLIDQGADLNNRDSDGDTPLFQALYDGTSSFAEMLLSKGADYTIVNNSGYTVLHVIAAFSNTECARVLERAKLRGLDPDAKDKKGKTARQYLYERMTPPEGFVAAFEELLESIRRLNATPVVEDVSEEAEEEFFEARETQEVGLTFPFVSIHGTLEVDCD